MGHAARVKIETVRRDLTSPDAYTRGHALHVLHMALPRQPELHAPAREVFRRALESETDSWPVTTSLVGLEQLDGPDATRPLWQRVLDRPNAVEAGRVAMAMTHPSHLPMLLAMIEQRPDYLFRRGAVQGLGRMHHPEALPTLLRLGEDAALRPGVVQALGELGDPRALPWLEPIVQDDTPLPELDERGAVLTLSDIAAQAIRRIQYHNTGQSVPASASPGLTGPPPLPPRAAAGRRAFKWPAVLHPSLLPLLMAGLEVAWLVFLFALVLFLVGDQKPTFAISDSVLYALALPLPVVGVIAAIAVPLAGLTPRWWHTVAVILGGSVCGLLVLWFGQEILTP